MSQNAKDLNRQAAELIPELWSMSLTKKLDKSGVAMKIVNRVYERELKKYGDTVHIGEIGDVEIKDYSEDKTTGGVSYDRPDATSQTLKIDQSKAFGIFLSDITQEQSNIKDLQGKFEERARTAIDLKRDTFVMSAFSEIPAANKPTSNIKLTPDSAYQCLVWLATTLKNNNAIQTKNNKVFRSNQASDGEAMPWVVVNPDVESVLLRSPEFIHATAAGDRVLREGSIGTIAGLDVLVSTNLPTIENKTGSGDSAVTTRTVNIMAGINEAIAFAGNITKVEKLRDNKFFGDDIRGLYVYGMKVVLPKALAGMTVDVTQANTLPAAA